eukprot:COSAG06_NODE_3852_length_4829_cov_3.475899_1_plen_162_part_00
MCVHCKHFRAGARGNFSPVLSFFSVSIVSLFKNKSRREAGVYAPGGGLLSQHLRRKTPAGVFSCLPNHSTCVCPEPVLAKTIVVFAQCENCAFLNQPFRSAPVRARSPAPRSRYSAATRCAAAAAAAQKKSPPLRRRRRRQAAAPRAGAVVPSSRPGCGYI